MRILYISHNFIPQPTSEGSAIHIWTTINALKECGHQVDMLVYGVSDYSAETGWKNPHKEKLVKALEEKGFNVCILPKKSYSSEKKSSGIGASLINAVKRLVSPQPIDYYEGPYYRDEIRNYAESIGAEAAVAYSFEGVSAAVEAIQNIPIAASTVDLDHVVRMLRKPKRKSHQPREIAKDLMAILMLRRLPQVEIRMLKQCNLVFNHAAQHARWLQDHGVKNTEYLPVAVPDNAKKLFAKDKDINAPLRIIMVGAVTATATRMGLRFLTQNILPDLNELWKKNKSFVLQIFGAGKMDEKTRQLMDYEWVKIMGYAEDIGPEFYNSDILLVPIPDNVGFRTRISEGFSYGCCVVTHTSNTLGMPELKNEENSLICETGSDFINAISRCLESCELRERLSAAARQTYEDRLDGTRVVGKRIAAALEETVRKG